MDISRCRAGDVRAVSLSTERRAGDFAPPRMSGCAELGRLGRERGRPLHALDAGCGRGAGSWARRACRGTCTSFGIDVNRVALQEAELGPRRRCTNVAFQESIS